MNPIARQEEIPQLVVHLSRNLEIRNFQDLVPEAQLATIQEVVELLGDRLVERKDKVRFIGLIQALEGACEEGIWLECDRVLQNWFNPL